PIGLHPVAGLRNSRSSIWRWFRTVLVYSLYRAVAAAILRIVPAPGVFVVQDWTGGWRRA
ncbi:MAG: hypothetical protein OXG72_20940, partial [Acidobacteria bacterium]|nr:hypothetical protein [Acidobacteriota bacterium]